MSDYEENEFDEEVEEEQEKSEEKPTPSKKKLPVLLEFVFNLSNLIMVMVSLLVAGISYISGVSLLNIALRTGITLIVVGFLLTTITRKIIEMSIEVTNNMLEEAPNSGFEHKS